MGGYSGHRGDEAIPVMLVRRHRSPPDNNDLPGLGMQVEHKLHRLDDREILGDAGDPPMFRDHRRVEIVDAAKDHGYAREEPVSLFQNEVEGVVVRCYHQVRNRPFQFREKQFRILRESSDFG
jgi:hypothetical protein